jgi:ribosome-associated toxin RatA of RatAB toxin-antitoxin module
MHQQKLTTEINASAAKCFQVICDFANYPQWQKSIKDVQILERNQVRPVVVKYKLDVIMKTVSYTLRYSYDEHDPANLVISWNYVTGDIQNIEGKYNCKAINPARTEVTFFLAIEIGGWVPGFIMKTLKEASMQETLSALKNRAEGLV